MCTVRGSNAHLATPWHQRSGLQSAAGDTWRCVPPASGSHPLLPPLLHRCNQLTGASVQLLTKLRRLSNLSVANCRNVNEAAIASLSTLHTLASIEF